MEQYQLDLYDFCSDKVKNELKTFCSRVNSSDADVLIIMAHKAVQLFYILLAQGHISRQTAEKVITSNLSLDFDCGYLKGKKIAILDDIVISGTSIASTVNKLLSAGVLQDDIEVIAIALDRDYFAMRFENTKGVSALHCKYAPEDTLCIELSAMISKVFSYYGIPYDIDFPVYEVGSVNPEALNAFHSNLFWEAVDVSNGNHKAGSVDVYTFFPAQSVRARLWTAIGVDLERCTAVKLRLYLKRYPDGTRECCVVPMCLFKEITQDALAELYDMLKPTIKPIFMDPQKPWKAQMRYLEFFVAHQLFVIFSEIAAFGRGSLFQENMTKQLFGPVDGETVYRHLTAFHPRSGGSPLLTIDCAEVDHSSTLNEYKASTAYQRSCEEGAHWSDGTAYQQGCWINQFIFTPFLWWYDDKEIKVRKKLKEQALHYVKDYAHIADCLFRLNYGLPMSVLQLMLKDRVPDISDVEAERAISAFLDRAIDEGIIVPTIHYSEDGKYLCRAFRHGEDLPFGAADQYRLVYFLKAIGQYIAAESEQSGLPPAVAEIALEKMIVLFYQMGLKRGNIFNRFLGFGTSDIIHSFLSVHGAIQGYTDSDAKIHIYSERDSEGNLYITWLTTWLYKNGLTREKSSGTDMSKSNQPISIDMDRAAQYLAENNRSAASPTVLCNIESIAELITTWYNGMVRNNKKAEFKDNITALTSCANRFVYASAIATENHYFFNYWKHQAQYALEERRSSRRLVARLSDTDDNKRYTSTITQGLYSGREKIQWRSKNQAQQVIEEVARDFLGSTSASVWLQLWDGVDTRAEQGEEKLKEYTNMAEGVLYFFSACFECLKSTAFWDSGDLPPDYASYRESYRNIARRIPQLDNSLFDALEDIAKLDGTDLGKKGTALHKLVSEVLFNSEDCVRRIEKLIRNMDPTYTVTYQSALVLDIAALDPKQIDAVLMDFWEQLPENSTKTALNLIRFPQKLDSGPYVKYGIFFGRNKAQPLDAQVSHTENNATKRGKFLYDTFQILCSMLNGRLSEIRGILLPHIPSGPAFEHNLQRNIKINATNFYNDVIAPLELYYKDRWKMQLVLGMDRYVDEQFLPLFHEWDTTTLDRSAMDAGWPTTCVLCYKEHVKTSVNPSNLMGRITYAQLKVSCGERKGLGLLMRIADRVVCVSCNHIFVDYSSKCPIDAVSANQPGITFQLKPLTPICQYQDDSETLPATDEIILLEPCWNGAILFDLSMLISPKDWTDAPMNTTCICYGCNDDDQMVWSAPIQIVAPVPVDYYQIKGDGLDEIQTGFSGGIYVGTDSQPRQIIGIHEGRFDELKKARMIPWASVQAAIKKVSERGFNNGKST